MPAWTDRADLSKTLNRYPEVIRVGLLLFVIALLPGCGLLSRDRGALRPDAAAPEEVYVDRLVEEPVAPGAIRARAVVKILRSGGKRLSGRAVIIAGMPNLFRIEFIGAFNQTAGLLLSDGRGVYSFSKGQAEYHFNHDPAYPYPFTSKEFVTFLLGMRGGEVYGGIDGEYRMELDDEGRVTEIVKLHDGGVAFRAHLGDYREVGGGWFPYSISIENGVESIRVDYISVELDAAMNYDLFAVPRGEVERDRLPKE